MKGNELSQWQLDAAAEFLKGRRSPPQIEDIPDDTRIGMRWADFVRIVAWYGAIRAKATVEGIDPDKPGMTFVESRADAARTANAEEGGGNDGTSTDNESAAADQWSPFTKQ